MTGDLAGIGVGPLRERRGNIVSIHLRMHTQHPALEEYAEGRHHMLLLGIIEHPSSVPCCHTVKIRRHPGKTINRAAAAGIECKENAEAQQA